MLDQKPYVAERMELCTLASPDFKGTPWDLASSPLSEADLIEFSSIKIPQFKHLTTPTQLSGSVTNNTV